MLAEPYLEASADLPPSPGERRVADDFRLTDEPRLKHARSIRGRAVTSPVDVELSDDTLVQPDVCLLTPERLARVRGHLVGAPDLAVEVISPGTARRDRRETLALFAASDLRELDEPPAPARG